MTEPLETPVVETAQTPETAAAVPADASVQDQPAGAAGLAEARDRYRAERDTARADLTAATDRIARLQRMEIERLAGTALAHADDLFSLSGNEPSDYLDDNGDVDPSRVAADIEAILTERPGLRRPAPAVDRSQGITGRSEAQPSWSSLFTD